MDCLGGIYPFYPPTNNDIIVEDSTKDFRGYLVTFAYFMNDETETKEYSHDFSKVTYLVINKAKTAMNASGSFARYHIASISSQ